MSENSFYSYAAGEPISYGDALYICSDSTVKKAIGLDGPRSQVTGYAAETVSDGT
jgi:hypothetical protein